MFSLYYLNFSYDEENNEWVAKHTKYPGFRAVSNAGSVLGTHEWTLQNDSKLCSGSASYKTKLSLSSCTVGQFTCRDGNCVDMYNR